MNMHPVSLAASALVAAAIPARFQFANAAAALYGPAFDLFCQRVANNRIDPWHANSAAKDCITRASRAGGEYR